MADLPLRPAIPSLGIIPFKPVAMLQAEEEARRVAATATQQPSYISELSGYISTCWERAKRAKYTPEQTMLKSLRARNGIYETDKSTAITQMGGSDVYVLLTATKCRAAEAWINDVMRPAQEKPWAILPTPIPELPDDVVIELKNEVSSIAMGTINKATALNLQFPNGELAEAIRDYARTRHDDMMEEIREEAELRAERMGFKIADQMAEGGWHDAFAQVVYDFVTLKAGVIKGPVLRRRDVKRWSRVGGKTQVVVEKAIVPEFVRVSPFDLYPAPDSRNPDDGYLIERHRITRSELQAMIGVPGYNEEMIRKALRDYKRGLHKIEAIDSQRDALEFSGETSVFQEGEKIEALEFWGSVQGSMLIDWGMQGDIDPELDYEVNAWKIGDYVIRAILNPDKLGKKPYSVDSYERVAGSFWGKGIPELMADIQDICNAVARAVVNNAALASGPQVEVNQDRLTSDSEQLWPWKIWLGTNQQMDASPVIRFYQPQVITEQLMKVFEFFSAMAEDQTGVPRWAYGNTDVGGAGATSSGLSMLMTNASRGVKESISHLDNMVEGCVERTYDYNMIYDPDETIKGDCKVLARGSSALLAREQQVIRTREILATTNNPTDLQILGIEGRANLLKAALKGLDLDVDDFIPDEKGIRDLSAKIEAQNVAMIQRQQGQPGPKGATPPPATQTLDVAGNPSGGTDANMFQNQPGATPGLREGTAA